MPGAAGTGSWSRRPVEPLEGRLIGPDIERPFEV
jgi:hypothetical protein